MKLGAHESTAGGLSEAWGRALGDGAEAVQVFTKSNRMWQAKPIGDADAAAFRAGGEKAGLLDSASVHASYLINLGASDEAQHAKSVAALVDELQRCQQIGVDKLVLHPGSHESSDEGCSNIARGLAEALRAAAGETRVLLETAAGQGNAVGRTFEELALIRERVPARLRGRVTICLDTCHVFAAGYDIGTPKGWDELVRRFDDLLGLGLLEAFHLNDSKKPLGCRVDRHEKPGQGCIGPDTFAALVNDDRFAEVPGYLELPPEENLACLQTLRGMRRGGPRDGAARRGRAIASHPARG